MSTTTIDDILAEVDKLDAGATPGPWGHERETCPEGAGDFVVDAEGTWLEPTTGNVAFQARARTLLPMLAAEVRKLQSAKADEIEVVLARHREAFGADIPQAPRDENAAKARAFDLLRADYEVAKAGRISCGHTVADLIGGIEKGPDGAERPCVTKCGACLAVRQDEIAAARRERIDALNKAHKLGIEQGGSLVREMIDRLTRDAAAFRQTAHVSVSDARIRADACRTHSEALAKLLTMARALAEDGHHDRAVALLRGDMPAPKETP